MSAWDCFTETLKYPPARKHFIVLCICIVASVLFAIIPMPDNISYIGLIAASIFAYNSVNGFSTYLIALRRYTIEHPGKWKKTEKEEK